MIHQIKNTVIINDATFDQIRNIQFYVGSQFGDVELTSETT